MHKGAPPFNQAFVNKLISLPAIKVWNYRENMCYDYDTLSNSDVRPLGGEYELTTSVGLIVPIDVTFPFTVKVCFDVNGNDCQVWSLTRFVLFTFSKFFLVLIP